MKRILFIVLLINTFLVQGQKENQVYPSGIYNTFEDFKQKEPSSKETFSTKENRNIINNTFRIKDSNGKKIKDAFALSDGQKLYVRTTSMEERFTNSEFDKPNTDKKDYSLANLINEKYVYFENYFQSKGVSNWGIGKVYLSGIIYNIEKGTFTALNSIDHLNSFLETENLDLVEKKDLQKEKFQITDTRKVMAQLFELE